MPYRPLLISALTAVLLGLAACATPFKANVSRFQSMPAAQGQSFTIQSQNPRLQGGLEFQQYANLVAERLRALGYAQVTDPRSASLVVNLDYSVDTGQTQVATSPGFGYSRWGGPWYGRSLYSRYYYGWDDPFWYRSYGEVDSYTLYTSQLDMRINRTTDGQSVFEGRARARSTDDSLPRLVPNLIEAMFQNFPGRSGEEVRITVPPAPRR
jgi:hypothetical protein